MKKCLFLIATAVCLVTCARKQDADVTDNRLTFVAKTESSADTRTVVEDETHVFWEPGDEIAVFSGEKSGKFVTNLSSSSATATFTGTLGEDGWVQGQDLWAVYPYSEKAVFDGETITTTLPSIQYARAGSFAKGANLAIAHSTNGELQFYNVCGGVRFSLKEEGVTRVVFESGNYLALAGKLSIGFNSVGLPVVWKCTDSSNTITVLPPSGEDTFQTNTWYYIVTLPVGLNWGYTFRLYKGKYCAKRISNNRVIIKRSIYGSINGVDQGVVYEPLMTSFPETKEEWKASEDFTNDLLSFVCPLINKCQSPSFDEGDPIDYFISHVLSIDGIVDAFPMDSNEGVVIVQKFGVHYNVPFTIFGEDVETRSSNSVIANNDDSSGFDYIVPNTGQRKCLMIRPYQNQYSNVFTAIPVFDELFSPALKKSGFSLTTYDNGKATRDVFLPEYLDDFDLIVFATHGGILHTVEGEFSGSCLMTSSCEPWNWELLKSIKNIVGIITGSSTLDGVRYGFTVSWLKDVEKKTGVVPSFKNSIVMAMACNSYTHSDFADYFIERGASVYCGVYGRIRTVYMGAGVAGFIDYLTKGYCVEDAIRLTKLDCPEIPLISSGSDKPVYLIDPRPTDLSSSVSSSLVSLQWKNPSVRWDYSADLFVDGELVASGLAAKIKNYDLRVYSPGEHNWYLETTVVHPDGKSKTFRSSTESFTIGTMQEMVDLGLSVKWASFNVGGLCPEDSGSLFAWGETEPQSSDVYGYDWYTWGSYKWSVSNSSSLTKYCFNSMNGHQGFTDNKSVLELEDDAAHCHLGNGLRIPTRGELQELLDNCLIESAVLGGVSGYRFTSLVPGYTDKWIFIVFGSARTTSTAVWSSTLDTPSSLYAWSCTSSGAMKSQARPQGFPIRPVCE